MPKFGNVSLERLSGCHLDLQKLAYAVVAKRDCAVVCGHRGMNEQQRAYSEGNSNAKPGQSPHNDSPSMAMDLMPYPIDWKNEEEVLEFRNLVDITANLLHIELHPLIKFRNKKGQLIIDLPHYELAEWHKKEI